VVWAHERRLIRACHDVSDGGLAQTLAEMAFASGQGLGFEATLEPGMLAPHAIEEPGRGWFSEEPGFVLEVAPELVPELFRVAGVLGARVGRLGETRPGARFGLVTGGRRSEADGAKLRPLWEARLVEAFRVSEEIVA